MRRALLAGARLVLMIESIANPDNVGGIFRNAAAFGVDGVLLDGATCDPLYRKAIRTSMGAVLRVPFARAEWADALPAVRVERLYRRRVDAARARRAARSICGESTRRTRWRCSSGTKATALSDAAAASADVRVRIPMTAEVDSLNVAVAAGIALSRLTRFADVW